MQVPETLKGNDYSKEKREELIINNIKLVEDIVKKRFPNSLYEEDELISIGVVGLIKSIDNFDSSKGIPFTSYLKKYINNELSRFLNKESKRIQFSSLDSSDEFIPLSTIASDYEDKELYKSVRNIVDGLPVIEREIVKLHYGFEENVRVTQTEIAKMLCISKSSVSRMLRRALGKVKVTLKRNDLIDISGDELNNVERTVVNEEDFKDVIKLLREDCYSGMLNFLTTKEAIVVCLKFGYVKDKSFSNDAIAKFLHIDSSFVTNTARKYLLSDESNSKDYFNGLKSDNSDAKILTKRK